MNRYFSGQELYGDDFSATQQKQWFDDEALGYFHLVQSRTPGTYPYHALNRYHGFEHLEESTFQNVLGLGSAFGDELDPILTRCENVTILEPADGFANGRFTYVKPQVSGLFPFCDRSFDLILCLSVLHHIPNVSTVIREIARCTAVGGYVLIREPITSMGDWRHPRSGLTKWERGIPLLLLRTMIRCSGLQVKREATFGFPLVSRLRWFMRQPVYNSDTVVRLDHLICRLPIWSRCYHARTLLQKLRPSAVFYVLQRPAP